LLCWPVCCAGHQQPSCWGADVKLLCVHCKAHAEFAAAVLMCAVWACTAVYRASARTLPYSWNAKCAAAEIFDVLNCEQTVSYLVQCICNHLANRVVIAGRDGGNVLRGHTAATGRQK
jgi:hypothetical protein